MAKNLPMTTKGANMLDQETIDAKAIALMFEVIKTNNLVCRLTHVEIYQRKNCSIKSLLSIKDVTEDDAQLVRYIWKHCTNRLIARECINRIIGAHGVEYLGKHKRNGNCVYYANTGDSYTSTIVWSGLYMRVQCWADYAERGLIVEGGSY
jgi:hypothetical protein